MKMKTTVNDIFKTPILLDKKGRNFKLNNIEFSSVLFDPDFLLFCKCEGENTFSNSFFESQLNENIKISHFSDNSFIIVDKFIKKFTENNIFPYNSYSYFLDFIKYKKNYFNFLKFYTNDNYRQIITQNLLFYKGSLVPFVQFILFKDDVEFNFNFFEFNKKTYMFNIKENKVTLINNVTDIIKFNKNFCKINELNKLISDDAFLSLEEKQYLNLFMIDLY